MEAKNNILKLKKYPYGALYVSITALKNYKSEYNIIFVWLETLQI